MGNQAKHHEVFDQFECWKGHVRAGFTANFLGVMTRASFVTLKTQNAESQFTTAEFPGFDEEYFEWIDLLEAVTTARGQFTMFELGAGYGRWLANAVAALRQVNNLPYTLFGVEPEPTHFEWMREHLQMNGVDLRRCWLIEAAVSRHDGAVFFYVGKPAEWYGQAIAPRPSPSARLRGLIRRTEVRVKKARCISLNTLLRPLEHVDLIDLDVQGAELDVLENSKVELRAKVKKVHIGTHGAEIESGLRNLFEALGWEKVNDYPSGGQSGTPFGVVKFQDGVQTWINPRL